MELLDGLSLADFILSQSEKVNILNCTNHLETTSERRNSLEYSLITQCCSQISPCWEESSSQRSCSFQHPNWWRLQLETSWLRSSQEMGHIVSQCHEILCRHNLVFLSRNSIESAIHWESRHLVTWMHHLWVNDIHITILCRQSTHSG
jgi:hypothetical protein